MSKRREGKEEKKKKKSKKKRRYVDADGFLQTANVNLTRLLRSPNGQIQLEKGINIVSDDGYPDVSPGIR